MFGKFPKACIALTHVVAFVSSVAAQNTPRPDEPGEFAVGHRRLELIDVNRNNRIVPVDTWYPVDKKDANGPLSCYRVLSDDDFCFDSEVAFEAARSSTDGPFPLVVFSHGGFMFSSQFSSMSELLTSHGFVVAAPNHTGGDISHAFDDDKDLFQDTNDRVADIPVVIDNMLEMFYGFDSMLSVVVSHSFLWRGDGTPIAHEPRLRLMRQEVAQYEENGAIYVFTMEHWAKYHNRLGGNIGLYLMPEEHRLQIDSSHDLKMADAI